MRDKIFTHSFLRACSVGCRKTQAHSTLNKKAVCLQQIWNSGVMQRNWVSAQARCHCSPAVLLSGVGSEQIPSSTAAQHTKSLLCHHLPTTAWGFHFLHDSLLNPLQIPNKHPDQLCGIILDAFLSASGCLYHRSRGAESQHCFLGYENVFVGVSHAGGKNLPHSECELLYKLWLLCFFPSNHSCKHHT